jgi:shikimate dehydrogenase
VITGIIGYPLDITLSPQMHKAAFEAQSLDGVYLSIPVEPARVEEVVDALRVIGCRGINVTNPHKEAVLSLLDEIAEASREVGAVNTVVFNDRHLSGYNTDVYGFEMLLRSIEVDINEKRILLIGAGGVAKAAAYVLNRQNPRQLLITDLVESKAAKLADCTNATAVKTKAIQKWLDTTDIVINASSVDLQKEVVPFLKRGSSYIDLNYKFTLQQREEIVITNGLEMLLHQGAKSYEIWTGRKAPIEVMRKALFQ